MKTSVRFEAALKKLYIAFHNNTLHPECCMQCAVGNILDNTDNWKHLSDQHGSLTLNYLGNVHQMLGRKFNGYSPLELLKIEATFLNACGYKLPMHHKNKKPKQPTN
ncbi:MAG TPA: Na(+)-translocating NADH-quinone reductase subunit F, partial [Mariniflexile sp.]|nr:Na(+)-translocating NADH-quinone reductase subunit F [Mariniflexile sp.]